MGSAKRSPHLTPSNVIRLTRPLPLSLLVTTDPPLSKISLYQDSQKAVQDILLYILLNIVQDFRGLRSPLVYLKLYRED
jgi:hypothetical protein